MNAPASLPANIINDIGIYLAPDEKIIKALSPFSSGKAAAGQVWLILTSHSIIFHTCEHGKEPLVALLPRKEIKEIEYFQRSAEIQLTFIPSRNTQKTSRLTFGRDKQDELEDFCEDLADLINFKKETAGGVKTYAAPRGAETTPDPQLRHAASAIRHVEKAPTLSTEPAEPPISAVPAASRTGESVKAPPPGIAAVKIVAPTPVKATSVDSAPIKGNNADYGEFKAGYVIVATLVSILVAFIWYKFFFALAGSNSAKSR